MRNGREINLWTDAWSDTCPPAISFAGLWAWIVNKNASLAELYTGSGREVSWDLGFSHWFRDWAVD